MSIQIVKLFSFDEHGELRPTVAIAVLEEPTRTRRAVFVGNVNDQALTFNRWEEAQPVEGAHTATRPWEGRAAFGATGPGAETRTKVRAFWAEVRKSCDLLKLAVEVAEECCQTENAWREARIRHLATLPADARKRSSGGFLADVELLGSEMAAYEHWQALRRVQRTLATLGFERAE